MAQEYLDMHPEARKALVEMPPRRLNVVERLLVASSRRSLDRVLSQPLQPAPPPPEPPQQ